ncbi:hypothetical protein J3F84DRAFT_159171 [Trichoderma pleuroticola]
MFFFIKHCEVFNDLVQFFSHGPPKNRKGPALRPFAFLFVHSNNQRAIIVVLFFLLLYFSLLVFWLFVLASGSSGRIRYGFCLFYCLALTRALGTAGAVFYFSFSALFFFLRSGFGS